jgi:hypothetical protein
LEALIRDALLNQFREDVPHNKYEEVLEKCHPAKYFALGSSEVLLNGRLNEHHYGKRIRLRAVEREDIRISIEYVNDPEVTRGLSLVPADVHDG